jgi:SWI/SNF-related matrix-associated actin-dependent regulator of chromatin subfamily A3
MSWAAKRPLVYIIDSDSDEPDLPVPKRHQAWRPQAVQPRPSQTLSSQSQPPASASSSFVEEPEVIDLTQDDSPESERELYGVVGRVLVCLRPALVADRLAANKIVGVRFYNGCATAGEVVICQREPSNRYDSNAIKVVNVLGHQIGHLPRTVAGKLAPYMVVSSRTATQRIL